MKKYGKLALCGMAAVMLIAGCSKKADTNVETSAPEVTEGTEAEILDKGSITKLGVYKGVELTKMSTEVTEAELTQRIQTVLDANPEYIEITGRPAQLGDLVNIDYIGMKDGTAFDGGTADGQKLELGSNSFIDGFEEGIVGANIGDELSLNLTFPADYASKDLAGQAVVFEVTVNGIEEIKKAELDNNFVQRMSDFTTIDEFKADTMADMEAEKELQAEQTLENDAFNAAVANSEFNLNQAAVDQQYDSQIEYYTSSVQMYGMTLADYLGAMGMTEESFQEELKTSSEMAIKQQLLVAEIATKEGLAVEDTDRQKLADEYSMTIDELKEAYGEAAVDETAMMFKVVGIIKDNAVIK